MRHRLTETIDDTPIQLESVHEISVQIETVDDTQFVVETVDETNMFADQRSSSREPDATDEQVVIETVDGTDIFAEQRSLSRTASFCPDITEVYLPSADLSPDILWDSAVRSPRRMSSLESLILQASDINDAMLEATRDALQAACEVDSSTVESVSFLDSVLQVT